MCGKGKTQSESKPQDCLDDLRNCGRIHIVQPFIISSQHRHCRAEKKGRDKCGKGKSPGSAAGNKLCNRQSQRQHNKRQSNTHKGKKHHRRPFYLTDICIALKGIFLSCYSCHGRGYTCGSHSHYRCKYRKGTGIVSHSRTAHRPC